jgi:hypothetical protein
MIHEIMPYYTDNKIPKCLHGNNITVPFFRVLELKDHDGNKKSVELQIKYCEYSNMHGGLISETNWMKVPRAEDVNGL